MRKALAVLILGSAGVSAATLSFTGLPLNTAFGTYNGFAYATVDGVPEQLLVCDDYDHTTYVPSGPLAYSVSTLVGANPLQYARFADPLEWEESIARYEQAALLVDGMLHTGPEYLLDLTAEYQYALWHLFTPSVALPSATVQTLLDQAADSVANPSANNFEIYARLLIFTPTSPFASNQEFLALASEPMTSGNAQAVPEPSGWVLMVVGIAVLVAVLKWGRFPTCPVPNLRIGWAGRKPAPRHDA